MAFSFLLILLNTTNSLDIPSLQGDDWTHPYGNPMAQAFLWMPEVEREIRSVYDFQSLDIPFVMERLFSVDVDGDERQELIGTDRFGTHCLIVDFIDQHVETIDLVNILGGNAYLDSIFDWDGDQIKELLFTIVHDDQSVSYIGYSPWRDEIVFQVNSANRLLDERALSVVDIDRDGQFDLLAQGTVSGGNESVFSVYSVSTGNEMYSWSVQGLLKTSSVALEFDGSIHAVSLVFATHPYASASVNDTSILCFDLEGVSAIPIWQRTLHPALSVNRLAMGRTNANEPTVVIGTNHWDSSVQSVHASITELYRYDGNIYREIPLESDAISDLSVGNLDQDEEYEITFLDSDQNMHRLDMAISKDRFLLIPQAMLYPGAGNMFTEWFADHAVFQILSNRFNLFLLNENLDPWDQARSFSVRSQIQGRPILGDTNGDGLAEVLFVTGQETFQANRLSYLVTDPPDPKPTPTVPPVPVQDWIFYSF